MELFETIKSRATYRGAYLPGTLSHASLVRVLQAAYHAPSGRNKQTVRMVAVASPEPIEAIATILDKPNLRSVGAFFVFAFDPEEEYGVQDCAAATENALLAIHALGYASCWLEGALHREERAARIATLLSIPTPFQVRTVLPAGRPAEPPKSPAKEPLGARAFLEKFGFPIE